MAFSKHLYATICNRAWLKCWTKIFNMVVIALVFQHVSFIAEILTNLTVYIKEIYLDY